MAHERLEDRASKSTPATRKGRRGCGGEPRPPRALKHTASRPRTAR
ncbi:hypothetical protein ACFLTX_00115 [Chloroflexota bacterium]